VIAVEEGRVTPMLRRETLEDLLRRDVLAAVGSPALVASAGSDVARGAA
jgi:hypothetical protein